MKEVLLRDLQPGLDYLVQVRSRAGERISPWSNTLQFLSQADSIAPSPITTLDLVTAGSAFVATWVAPSTNTDGSDLRDLKDYVVTVYPTGVPLSARLFITTSTRFELSFEQNVAAFGTPQPALTIEVVARDTSLNPSSTVSDTATNAAPNAITDFLASGGYQKVTLTWTPSTSDDVVAYDIVRDSTVIATLQSTATTFVDLAPGSAQRIYSVTARDIFGQETQSGTTAARAFGYFRDDATTPNAPGVPTLATAVSLNSADGSMSYIEATFAAPVQNTDGTAYSDNSHFRVRWSANGANGPWNYMEIPDTRVGGSSAANFVARIDSLPSNKQHWVEVAAVDRYGMVSTYAAANVTTARDLTPPGNMGTVTGAGGIETISLSWARMTEADLDRYEVRQVAAANSAFSTGTVVYSGNGTTVSFAVPGGGTRFYRVAAYDRQGNSGSPFPLDASNALSVTATASSAVANDTTAPAVPTGIGTSTEVYTLLGRQRARIVLSWTAPADADLAGYYVRIKRTADADTEYNVFTVDASKTSFIFDDLAFATGYTVGIRPFDKSGNANATWTTATITSVAAPSTADSITLDTVVQSPGVIRSNDFNATTQTGWSLGSSELVMFDGRISLGTTTAGFFASGTGADSGRIWSGNAAFASANWRVDTDGAMQVGPNATTSTKFDAAGNFGTGGTTIANSPFNVTNAGVVTMTNARITSSAVPNSTALINADSKFIVQKTSGGVMEVRLAGNMYIDASGNLQLNGGAITLTSGNFTMNGGTMSLAGGSALFNGATVEIRGSDLSMTGTGSIVIGATVGANTGTGNIRSSNWAVDSTGFRFHPTEGAQINSGRVSAAALDISRGANMLRPGYASFEVTDEWLALNTIAYNAIVTSSTAWWQFGERSVHVAWNGAASTSPGIQLTDADPRIVDNIVLQQNKSYILSAYVRNNNASARTFTMRFRQGVTATTAPNAHIVSQAIAAGSVARLTIAFSTTGMTVTEGWILGNIFIGITSTPASGDSFSVDGVMLEQQTTSVTTASTFVIGGQTSIDGGLIRTGEIRSNVLDDFGNPLFQIDTNGNATFRGSKFVVGNDPALMPGAGLVFDEMGLRLFNTVGEQTVWLDPNTGSADFRGTITATGGRIEGSLDIVGGAFHAYGVNETTGDRETDEIVIDSAGLRAIGADGTVYVNIPTETGEPARWNSEVAASDLTADKATLPMTFVPENGTFTMESIVPRPTTAPTVTTDHESVQFTNDGLWGNRHGWDTDGTYYYTARNDSRCFIVEKWNPTTGKLVASKRTFYETFMAVSSCVMNGNVWVLNQAEGSEDWWVDLHPVGTLESANSLPWGDRLSSTAAPAIGKNVNNGNIIIARAYGATASTNYKKVYWREYNPDTAINVDWGFQAGSRVSQIISDGQYWYAFPQTIRGTFDLPGERFVLTTEGNVYYRTWSISGTLATNMDAAEFWAPGGTAKVGFCWNGTINATGGWMGTAATNHGTRNRWQSMDTTGLMRTFEPSTVAGATSQEVRFAAYSWYRAANVGLGITEAETQRSTSVSSFTFNDRMRTKVATPALPAGTTNARVYVSRGTVPTTFGQMFANGITTNSARSPSQTIAVTDFASSADLLTSTFVAGTPGMIQSAALDPDNSLPILRLDGAGFGRFRKIHIMTPGGTTSSANDVSLTAGSGPFYISQPGSTVELALDNNEIMCRSNGAGVNLALNYQGGDVTVGGTGVSTLYVRGGTTVGLATDTGTIVTGDNGGAQIAIGTGTIQARTGSAAATLELNPFGGVVRVGETNSTNLHVKGRIIITSVAGGDAGAPAYTFSADSGDNSGMYWNGENEIGFSTGGVQRFVVGTGQVRTDPGTIAMPGYSFIGDSNTGFQNVAEGTIRFISNGALEIVFDGTNFYPEVNSTTTSTGNNMGTSTRAWRNVFTRTGNATLSDERVKTAIKTTPLGLDFVLQLQPIEYEFDDPADPRKWHGFSAQQVERIADNMGVGFAGVRNPKREYEMGLEPNTKDKKKFPKAWEIAEEMREGMKTAPLYMDYTQFIAPLVRSVQQQQTQIDELKALVSTLSEELARKRGEG